MAAKTLELRDLRYIVAVVEAGSLSRAASSLGVAQPALTRQVHALEHELGVALLDRHARGVAPTYAGQVFVGGAVELLEALGQTLDRADAVCEGRRGRVAMGAMLAPIAAGIPGAVVEQLRRERPDITVVVHDFDPLDLVEQVLDGSLDVAITMRDTFDPRLGMAALWQEPLDHVCLPADHPLAARASLTVPELGELPLEFPQRAFSPAFVESLLALLRASGLRSPLRVTEGNLRTAHLEIAAGRGWLPMSRTRAAAPPVGTAAVPLSDFRTDVDAVVLWRRDEHRPVVRTVLEAVLAVTRRHPASVPPGDVPLPPAAAPTRRPRRPPGFLPPGLNVRHLRALLEVAAEQTIGRAARRLGVTQPALSRQLRELEDMLALPLLERSARGVSLAPAGAALAGDCPGVLRSLDRLVRETRRARRGMQGHCVVGAVATVAASELLGRLLVACANRHPHLHITIEDVATPAQTVALERGEIDLGLAHAYPVLPTPALRHQRVYEDRLQAALVSTSHPLAGRKRLAAGDLAGVPLLFMDRGFHPLFHDRLMQALGALGLTPRVDSTYDGLQVVWSLAAQGKGWAFGFRSHLKRPPAGTVAVPIAGLDVPWGLDLLRRKVEPSLAVRSVAQVIREVARARTPPAKPKARARRAG